MSQYPPKRNKLRPQPMPPMSFARGSLLKRLESAAHKGVLLSLVKAPMGYGKSTLLAQHIANLNQPWIWYRFDSTDNQPLNLLVQWCHAFELPIPEGLLGRAGESGLWTLISNHLEHLNAPLTLVLDDLHLLRSPTACAYLEELLRHPPKNLHLIAACEGEPVVSLSHLHRDQRLQVLDLNDLALDSSEINALASARGQTLNGDLIYLLRAGTEGWISGILFGLSTYSGAKISDFNNTDALHFLTRHAFAQTAQFFQEEILRHLTPRLLQFLSRLSVVSAFDASLAAYISGLENAEQLIRQLQRQDLFVQQRKGEGLVFRLHPLLRRTLYQSLERQDPNLLNQLHRRAADWLLARRYYTEGVYQLGRARDFNGLLAALEQHSFNMLREGEVNGIVDFLADVPDENSPEHFTLAVTEASAVIVTNDISQASGCLRRLKRLILRNEIPERRPERVHQTLAFLRSRLAVLGGNFNYGLKLVERARQQYPTPSAATAVLLFNQANCLFALGHLKQANTSAHQALSEFEALGFSGYTNMLQLLLGQIEVLQGEIGKASARFQGAGISTGAPHSFYDLFLHLGLCSVLLQQNRLDQAALGLSQAEAIALDFPHSAGLPWVLHLQACGLMAAGKPELARHRWDEARRLAKQFKLFALYRQVGACRVRLAGAEHDQAFIRTWLEEWQWCRRQYGTELMPEEWLAYAWVQRHQGEPAQARQVVEILRVQAEAESNQRLLLELWLLNSALCRDQGDQEAALSSLEQAVQLAARHGYGQLLQFESELFTELFRELLNPQIRRQLGLLQPLPAVELLLSRPQSGSEGAAQPLDEPLTRREQDVLQRMIRGQTNQHIADSLYVSLSTVKTHINNLFRKLNVSDRESAIHTAHRLKLVD